MEWLTASLSGPVPTPRSGHSSVLIGSQMYVFGGYEQRYLSELHALNTGTLASAPLDRVGTAAAAAAAAADVDRHA